MGRVCRFANSCHKAADATKHLARFHVQIACSDIGFFAALAFQQPEKYAGKQISLAGDELDMSQLRKQFAEEQEYQVPQTFGIIGWLLANGLKEVSDSRAALLYRRSPSYWVYRLS